MPQPSRVHQVELVGLVDEAFELALCGLRRDVDDRLAGARHGDPAPAGRRERSPSVHAHASASRIPPDGNGHVNGAAALLADRPQRRGAVVAEDGAVTARQYGRHPRPLPRQLRPPHGVDLRPHRMEPASAEPVPDRLVRVAERDELRTRDHAMLPPRHRPHTRVRAFRGHNPRNHARHRVSPPKGRGSRRATSA